MTARSGIIAVIAVLGACKPTTTIALADGSRAPAPAFTLSRTGSADAAHIAAFRIDACAARGSPPMNAHWLTLAPDTAEALSGIEYGIPPRGWRSVQGPQPLDPGCYRAAVAGSPPLEFDVLPEGGVTARR